MNLPRGGDGSASRSMPARATKVRATPNQGEEKDAVEPGQAPIHAEREERDAGNRSQTSARPGGATPERRQERSDSSDSEGEEGRSAEKRAGGGIREPLRVRSDPGREVLEFETRHDDGEEKCRNTEPAGGDEEGVGRAPRPRQ